MDIFPELSKKPSKDGYEESIASDPTIKSEFADGTVATRPMFTGLCLAWKLSYKTLSTIDKNLLSDFVKEQKVGSGRFYWINPVDGYRYTVRFSGVPVFKLASSGPLKWQVSFEVQESEPNSKTEVTQPPAVITGASVIANVTGGILDIEE